MHFTSSETSDSSAGLAIGGSTLFGTTRQGGASGKGAIFKINADGTGYGILKYFTNSADGAIPSAALILSQDTLYGTASRGGSINGGTVFKLKTNGTGFTVLKSLTGVTATGVILSGSTLFGTTYFGGNYSDGTVFKMNTDGTGYTTLFQFGGTNGAYPQGDLILSAATLYGTTMNGGSVGRGTVFRIDTNGMNFAVLKHFTLADGAYPIAPLTLLGNTLYGTTSAGGLPSLGTIFRVNTNGTGFVTLFWFTNTTLVGNPGAGLMVSGTTLYGTAYNGLNKGKGAVFKLNTDGSGFAILKNFIGPDGAVPQSGLTFIGTRLYGTTRQGGGYDLGTIFSVELAPVFTSVAQDNNGNVELSITGEPRKNYTVYATTNFSTWDPLGTVSNATGSALYTDEQAGQFSSRFYRAVQSP
jgi:uncharacterized repeat protein (TIGR03803 family)